MKHQKQGPAECLPTVWAMLSDISKATIIDPVLQELGYTLWYDFSKRAIQCNGAERQTLFGLNGKYTPYIPNKLLLPKNWDWAAPYMIGGVTSQRSIPLQRLQGKGAILLQGTAGPHIVAFEDQTVYDPGYEAPMTYREWQSMGHLLFIQGVFRQPDQTVYKAVYKTVYKPVDKTKVSGPRV